MAAGLVESHYVRCVHCFMRRAIIFLLFLVLVEQIVSAEMQSNQENNENIGLKVKDASEEIKLPGDNPYGEGSSKWNIDLSDMLNFKSSYSGKRPSGKKPPAKHIPPEKKAMAKEKLRAILRGEKLEPKHSSEDSSTEYDEEEVTALIDGDEDLQNHIRQYLIRYVNLFLNLLELKDKRPPVPEGEDIVDFDFVISSKDLKALQDLADHFEERSVYEQLYVIDAIISKGIRLKQKRTIYQMLMRAFEFGEVARQILQTKSYIFYMLIGVILTAAFARHVIGLSYRFITFLVVNNMILMEGLFNYFRKIKEANIEDHVDRLRYTNEYEACNVKGQSIFGKLYDMFYENECLTYHRNMQINRADSIFPLESILSAYAYYAVELPSKFLGSAINQFVVSLNAYLPSVFRGIGQVSTQFCVLTFLLILFILYIFAPQISFNFFGAGVNFNLRRNNRANAPGIRNPRKYRRIRGTSRAALNAIEAEHDNEDPADNPEGSDSSSEDIEDVYESRVKIEEMDDSSSEDEIEMIGNALTTDSEYMASEEEGLPEDVDTTKGLPSEN